MEHMDYATGKLTVTDHIYNQILRDISNGAYAVGEKLPSESALCKEYKASRISVRSALQRLEAIGLIEIFQGRGSYVKGVEKIERVPQPAHTGMDEVLPDGTLPMETYEEFWQFRQALGDRAMELFVLRAAEKDYEILRGHIDKMIDAEDFEDVTLATINFHMYIYQNCGNRFIVNTFTENKEVLALAFRTIQKKHYQSKAVLVRWHEKILELLQKGDVPAISLTISEENVQFTHGVHNAYSNKEA